MTPIIPNRFLVRVCHPCPFVKGVPHDADNADHLVDLPDAAKLQNFAALDGLPNFADVRLAWNEFGLGVELEVKGKDRAPLGDEARARGSDGITIWIDTRDSRGSHRATRYCHQFHLLAAGSGADKEEPFVSQSKIHRALEDAPIADPSQIPIRRTTVRGGYVLEAFLPAQALNGYDPEQHPRLGFFWSVRDDEWGEQLMSIGPEFPFWEDPTLWANLQLQPGAKS